MFSINKIKKYKSHYHQRIKPSQFYEYLIRKVISVKQINNIYCRKLTKTHRTPTAYWQQARLHSQNLLWSG